jgi:uncharacterized membrane protein YGL010W
MTHENESLLARQFAGYADAHRDRRNLILHAFSAPFSVLGNCAVLAAPFTIGWLALGGVALMATAFALQGRGHGLEAARPAPFAGPLNAVLRIFAEQWITFPRFVLSGRFSRAWRRTSADRRSQGDLAPVLPRA